MVTIFNKKRQFLPVVVLALCIQNACDDGGEVVHILLPVESHIQTFQRDLSIDQNATQREQESVVLGPVRLESLETPAQITQLRCVKLRADVLHAKVGHFSLMDDHLGDIFAVVSGREVVCLVAIPTTTHTVYTHTPTEQQTIPVHHHLFDLRHRRDGGWLIATIVQSILYKPRAVYPVEIGRSTKM